MRACSSVVEHRPYKTAVAGSIPARPTHILKMPDEQTENNNPPEIPGYIGVRHLELSKLEERDILMRNAEQEDYDGLAKVIQDVWDYRTREWGSEKRDISKTPTRMDFLEKSISEPEKTIVLLITVDGEVAGFVHLEKTDDDAIIIDTLFTLEKYYGTGIGYSLLSQAEDIARNVFGAKEIRLGTHSCNKDALKLYGRNGYEELETEEKKDEGFSVKGEKVYKLQLVKKLEPKN